MGTGLQPTDPSRIGPYQLVGVLGSGGMGRVYLGRSPGGRQVAVKVIRPELAADPEFRARFRREVDAARKVNGLYTAGVVDADADAEMPWLVTAYVAGPSLAEVIVTKGALDGKALRALGAGLAEGIGAIHAVGLVHRDLKPQNVLLSDDGPRVIDFGISRAAEDSVLTASSVAIGSPAFMSPEQAEGGDIGPASDVFSVGGLLCYAATGHGPFGSGPAVSLLYRVVHGSPDLDGVPAEMRPLVRRCLAKNPGDRPTTAQIVAELGDGVLDGTASPAVAIPVAAATQVAARHTAGPPGPTIRASRSPGARPSDQVARTSPPAGAGQAFIAIGGVTGVAGFGMALSGILSAASTVVIDDSSTTVSSGGPAAYLPVGIVLFTLGIILVSIGIRIVRLSRGQ